MSNQLIHALPSLAPSPAALTSSIERLLVMLVLNLGLSVLEWATCFFLCLLLAGKAVVATLSSWHSAFFVVFTSTTGSAFCT